MRRLKLFAIGAVLLAAIIITGSSVAGVIANETQKFTALAIEDALGHYLGRPVKITGPVTVKLGSPTKLSISGLEIANEPWAKEPQMLTVGKLDVTFYPKSLVKGPKRVPLIAVQDAKLRLDVSKDGARNWAPFETLFKGGKSGAVPVLKSVSIENSEITYNNEQTGKSATLAANRASLKEANPKAPVRLAFDGTAADEPLKLSGTIGPLGALKAPTQPYPVDLTGSYAGGGFFVKGAMAKPLALAGLDLKARIDGVALAKPLSRYLGREVTIAEPVELRLGSPSRLTFGKIAIANADWGTAPEMLSLAHGEVTFDASSLLRGPAHVQLVALDGAKLLFESSKSGQGNWPVLAQHSGAPKAEAASQRTKPRSAFPILNRFEARNVAITYRNGATGAVKALDIASATLDAPKPDAPAKIALAGAVKNEPLRLSGSIGALASLRQPKEPYPVDLDGALGKSRLEVKGTMRAPLTFAGVDLRMSLEGVGLQKLAKAFGVPLPPLPDFRATSVLTGGNGKWTLGALSAKVGASDLEGGIGIDLTQAVPFLKANLTSSYLDVADFAGFLGAKPAHTAKPVPQAKTSPANGRIIPATPIAASLLKKVNVDLGFSAGRVKNSKGIPLERVSASLHLRDGVLTLKPLDFAVARGTVDFALTLDTRPKTPDLRLDLDVRHIDLHELVRGLKKGSPLIDQTAGRLGGFVHFTSSGSSLRQLLGGMNGTAALYADEGKVSALLQQAVNLNVLRALGLLVTGDHPTPLNCLVTDFALKNGIATSRTTVLDTSTTLVVGRGNVNFPSGTIDFNLMPYSKGPSFFTLRSPITVRGTLAHPTYGISAGRIAAKVAAGTVLGVLLPPVGELLPFIKLGLGSDNACARAFSAVRTTAR